MTRRTTVVGSGIVAAILLLPGAALSARAAEGSKITVAETLDVAPVWAGHPVGLCLLTQGQRQYVAYYDAERRLTVATRTLDQSQWQYQVLPTSVGWDSHNYVTMALDAEGCLHLSGNMHCVPLIYFRSERSQEIATLRQVEHMVGTEEEHCTYPRFFEGPEGSLIFTYRTGRSGNGEQILNRYDTATHAWRRLLDRPLFDGQGKMSAYLSGPLRGPDGRYHLCWMWRDTPDCATNHDLSYACSSDLVHWETAAGAPLTLPITLQSEGVSVDPVAVGQGLINASYGLGFDATGRPVISYQKYDAAGKSQIFNARWETDRWARYQSSHWDYRWEFKGGGSIVGEIGCSAVRPLPDGSLAQEYHHVKAGSGVWRLEAATLQPVGTAPREFALPAHLGRVESSFPGMQVRTSQDLGEPGEPGVRYVLRWESLPPNRDRPRPGTPPEPSRLRLYKLVRSEGGE